MARKFVDVIGGRDNVWNAATWGRLQATLPNGDPFWWRSGEDAGSPLPPGTDFATHDWSFDFWIYDRISSWGDHQSFYVNLATPVASETVWFFNTAYTTRIITFEQRQTDGLTAYRRRVAAAGYSETARHHIAVTCPVGQAPNLYIDSVLSVGAGLAPTGSPKVVTAAHRFKGYGYNSGTGWYGLVAKPAYYPRVLTNSEIASIYSAMESA